MIGCPDSFEHEVELDRSSAFPFDSTAFEPQQISVGSELRGARAGCYCYRTLCMQTTDDFVASCLAFVTSTQPKVCPLGGGSLRLRYRECKRDAVLVAVDIAEEQTRLPLPSFE